MLLLVLAGCSVPRLLWSNAPALSTTWADSWLDFDDAQEDQARALFADWFNWQQATQLQGHAELLARFRAQARGEVTPRQLCDASAEVVERAYTGVRRLMPGAAEVARGLRPGQLRYLERRQAKRLRELRETLLDADPAERRAKAEQRLAERLESFYGELSLPQRAMVQAAVATAPLDTAAWLAERQAFEQDLLARLRALQAERADAARYQAALWELAQQLTQSPRPAYRALQQRAVQHQCTLVAQVHNSASAQQRQRVADKLKGWEDDLRLLAASPG